MRSLGENMKYLLLFMFLPFFSVSAERKWMDNFDSALSKAKKDKKPVLIDLYTDWCGYCQVLKKKIFPAREVESELKNFITVRINGDEVPEIPYMFQVKGYPTILFLDKNGAYLDRLTGLPDVKIMTSKLRKVYEKKDLEQDLLKEAKKNPDAVTVNYRLGIYYYKISSREKAISYFMKSVNSPRKENPEKKMESLFNIGIIQMESKKFSEAVSIWTKYIEDYPRGDISSAYYYRGVAHMKGGQSKEAKSDFESSLKAGADSETREKIEGYMKQL